VIRAEARDATTDDAELALNLFIRNPILFGGIVLRGGGPVRDAMLDHARSVLGSLVKIPANVDQDRLLGGLDLSATLAAGRKVDATGLLESAADGAVLVPLAERVSTNIAAHLAQAIDGAGVAAILLDDGCEADEAPPAALMERIAFHCDVSTLRDFQGKKWPKAKSSAKVQPLTDEQLATLAAMASALGVHSARALNFAQRAARAHAALHGRRKAGEADITAAIRVILAPRATQLPHSAPPPEQAPESETPDASHQDCDDRSLQDIDLDDIMLEAAAAAIPPHILDQIDRKLRGRSKGQAGRAGQKQRSALRGRPLSARAGVPGHGKRLALIDTLRAAAPWQAIRRQAAQAGDDRKIHIRKSDLRVRAFEQRSESLTIFAVDASGSSALSRLAEAKGAVELMLAQAYVKRAQVALVAFRGAGADILLPPTRSLTRARRALSALPGGGGTPLAAGLIAAQQLAEAGEKRGQSTTIAILTDGKANVALDGSANRDGAMAEAQVAARGIAALGLHSIVVDISPRPRAEAAELAAALGGRYLPLPHAHSAAMVAAIESIGAGQ
jgi:magnesium chelatase subunit D